jgi:D-psicose/D-tagatose/L-ribulose 3-epimerase
VTSHAINPLGVHALVFVSGWSQEEAARAVDHAAAAGYRYLEIPLIDPRAINVKETRHALEKAGIKPITSLGLGAETDISSGDPSRARRGEALLNDALAVARDLGSDMLSGVLYSALRKYQQTPTEAGQWNAMKVLGRLAEKAGVAGMTIGIEPVNRYESNLINTGDDALLLIEAIGADNMVVHLDSYHMNIEEGAPGPLIERLGDRLGYVHVNESHRGYLGTGSIDFDALFLALAEHGYEGVITFEAFSAGIGDPALNADLAVWRNLWDDPDHLAVDARMFMTRKIEQARSKARSSASEASFNDGTPATAPEERPSTAPAADPAASPSAKALERGYGWSRT